MAPEPNTHPEPSEKPAGVIFDVKRFAIHDGPGIRTTVFLKGCPLRCRWCHNPESWRRGPELSLRAARCTGCGRCVEACPNEAVSIVGGRSTTDPAKCVLCGACVEACPAGAREIVGRRVTADEIMAEIRRDVIFYDESGGGATFSGGEPLVQAAFLEALLLACRDDEIHTALDTSCHAPREVIEKLSGLVDLFLVDLKQMDPAGHLRFTGVSNELILENLTRLARMNKAIIIRVPLIAGLNDDERNIAATAEFVSSLDGVTQIDLLPHNRAVGGKTARLVKAHELMDAEPPSSERLSAIARQLQGRGFTVRIGG